MSASGVTPPRQGGQIPSDRSFGAVFTVFFLVVALWPALEARPPRSWCLGVAGVFLIVTLLRPALLRPLNFLWMRFGALLNRIVSPVVIGLVYCLAIVPTGLVLRALGKDPLRLKWEPGASTYWVPREMPGPEPGTMVNQF